MRRITPLLLTVAAVSVSCLRSPDARSTDSYSAQCAVCGAHGSLVIRPAWRKKEAHPDHFEWGESSEVYTRLIGEAHEHIFSGGGYSSEYDGMIGCGAHALSNADVREVQSARVALGCLDLLDNDSDRANAKETHGRVHDALRHCEDPDARQEAERLVAEKSLEKLLALVSKLGS